MYGNAGSDLNGATQKLKITPANMALAIGFGIENTSRASAGQSPVRATSSATKEKAPTTSENLKPRPPEAIISAAPGVDHTMLSGILNRHDKTIERVPNKTSIEKIVETI